MKAKLITKLVVSHRGALKSKYGTAGLKRLDAALVRMKSADAKRGITTSVVYVDGKDIPASVRATSRKNAKAAKGAVDHLCQQHKQLDYLLLLGAPDVIPYQPLDNPLPVGTADDEDPDPTVYSDLPYACDAKYSTTIKDFIGPTRAVGRLPDLTGGKQAAYLVDLIDGAARHKASKTLGARFALTTQTWPKATKEVLRRAFGSAPALRIAPPHMTPMPAGALQPTVHLINCHGGLEDPNFYGEDEVTEAMDESMTPADVNKSKQRGTLAVAECCYGAELYDAGHADLPICSTYLAQGALGFLGSTTTAYGASTAKLEDADVLCSKFLELVAGKASLGRALLEARLFFVASSKRFSGFELKTLAQFVLLGDPSLRAVEQGGAAAAGGSKAKKGKPAKAAPAPAETLVARHTMHRAKLAHEGKANQTWAGSHALKLTRVAASASRMQMAVAMAAPRAPQRSRAKARVASAARLATTLSTLASDAALAATLVVPQELQAQAAPAVLYRYTWTGPGKTVATKEGEVLFCFSRHERGPAAAPKMALHAKSKAKATANAQPRRLGPRRIEAIVARMEGGKVAEVVRLVGH